MARLPLHTLPTFRTVAKLANLRAAAEQLHLTHSAISQQIRLLEEQIGFTLFDRRGRRLALNAAGRTLLRAVEPALDQLDHGMRAAAAAAIDAEHRIRLTVIPSFAQRWLLPRMSRWHERHPQIGLELHASQQVIDLQREGFHAALRQGNGRWPGLTSERLFVSPLIAVGSPEAARRVGGGGAAAIQHQPLLGSPALWERWFALEGLRVRVNPVAAFNDAGMMVQASEQDLGIALVREVLAADALYEGKLMRLSPGELPDDEPYAYWLVYPSALADWSPIGALREWLLDELAESQARLNAAPVPPPARRGKSRARR